MQIKKSTLAVALLFACAMSNAQTSETVTADFEDITLEKVDTFINNPADGYFVSHGLKFTNDYHPSDWGDYWYDFSISNETANAYASLTNQYRSCYGGASTGNNFAVAYYSTYASTPMAISSNEKHTFNPQSVDLTNAAYAFTSMRTGDAYAKKFTQDDSFKLHIIGKKNGAETATVTVDLAKDAMILFAWKTVDLTALGTVDEINFSMESTDSGQWGMNTPSYFCMDNFKAIINNDATAAKQVAAAKTATVIGVYNMDGTQKSEITAGINIIKYSDGSCQKIYK